jgi:hypothetical protein
VAGKRLLPARARCCPLPSLAGTPRNAPFDPDPARLGVPESGGFLRRLSHIRCGIAWSQGPGLPKPLGLVQPETSGVPACLEQGRLHGGLPAQSVVLGMLGIRPEATAATSFAKTPVATPAGSGLVSIKDLENRNFSCNVVSTQPAPRADESTRIGRGRKITPEGFGFLAFRLLILLPPFHCIKTRQRDKLTRQEGSCPPVTLFRLIE